MCWNVTGNRRRRRLTGKSWDHQEEGVVEKIMSSKERIGKCKASMKIINRITTSE